MEVDLKNKPKDLLELNPYAKVPVLVDGAGVIYESAIINEYLDEKFPELPILPKNALQRAKADLFESELIGKQFIVGNYSLADVSFIPFYARRQRYGVTIDDNFPNLKRWGEELMARPAVTSTL